MNWLNPQYIAPARALHRLLVDDHIANTGCRNEHPPWDQLPFADGKPKSHGQLSHIGIVAFLAGDCTAEEMLVVTGNSLDNARRFVRHLLDLLSVATGDDLVVTGGAMLFAAQAVDLPPSQGGLIDTDKLLRNIMSLGGRTQS